MSKDKGPFMKFGGQVAEFCIKITGALAKRGITSQQMWKFVAEADEAALETVAEAFAKAMEGEMDVLARIRFGQRIFPPFNGAELVADGPGDEELVAGIDRLKLVDILTGPGDDYISFKEACKRGSANPATNWGQRAAFALRDAGNAGMISTEVFPVGEYVVFPKTRWLDPQRDRICVWVVVRSEGGFSCDYHWFGTSVTRRGRFASL